MGKKCEPNSKVRLMFQDEAGFGRINKPKRCWCKKKIRPSVPCHHIREYRYAYGAVEPMTGENFFLVMPYCSTNCMNTFLEEFIRNKYKTHHRSLTDAEENAILAPFEKAAEAGQVVTVKEIKAAFDKVRGKDTGRGYIYMLLKRHGWRKVMPRSKHPKAADEEACDASKKLNNLFWKWEKSASRTQESD